MSIHNKWQALSMKDRAFLIREAVRNGITDIGSIRDTWEHRFDGESNQPTEDEYIAYKADSVRQAALNRARNRAELKAPIIGYYTVSKPSLEAHQEELERINNSIAKFQSQLDEHPENHHARTSLEYFQGRKEAMEKQYKRDSIAHAHNVKLPEYGPNCIYTVTGDYGRPVSGNETFQQVHRNKGFKKIPFTETLPGDIVQFKLCGGSIPNHALMANTPYNSDLSQMRYNGSSGGTDEGSLRINARYPTASENQAQAYRFVGNHADSVQWRNEYQEKYPPKPVFDSMPGVINNPIHNILDSRVSIMSPDITKSDGHKFGGEEDHNGDKKLVVKDANQRLERVENNKARKGSGWDDVQKVWRPHSSWEGGTTTIGYGLKLMPGTDVYTLVDKQGFITEEQERSLRKREVEDRYDKAKKTYDNIYGIDSFNDLGIKTQSLLVDKEYNVRGGVKTYPKLMNAAHRGDLQGMRDNIKVYGRDKKTGELISLGRNDDFKKDLDSIAMGYYTIKKRQKKK